MSNQEPVFSLRGAGKTFGAFRALQGIDLNIMLGEQVALVGPSGAGKSTLLSLLNGTLAPSEGTVQALGHDLARLSPRARRAIQRRIGTIYQQFYLTNSLRVIHNINAGHLGRWSLPKSLLSLLWPLEVKTAASALQQVGIPEKLYERTGNLSGGQQQRVALARVLVQNPDVILADEPISSLDPERAREIMTLLRDLSAKSGKTLITSVHNVHFALSHFDRVIGLREGRIMFDASADLVTPAMIEALYHIDNPQHSEAEPETVGAITTPEQDYRAGYG